MTLPQSLEELTFGTHFNHSLDKVKLPVNLQSLTLGRAFNQTLQLKWPKLTKLTLQGSLEYNGLQDVELPDTLRELCCGWPFGICSPTFEPSRVTMKTRLLE